MCEHRWQPIYKMVSFRNKCHNATLGNFWSNGNAVGVARYNRYIIILKKSKNIIPRKLVITYHIMFYEENNTF